MRGSSVSLLLKLFASTGRKEYPSVATQRLVFDAHGHAQQKFRHMCRSTAGLSKPKIWPEALRCKRQKYRRGGQYLSAPGAQDLVHDHMMFDRLQM